MSYSIVESMKGLYRWIVNADDSFFDPDKAFPNFRRQDRLVLPTGTVMLKPVLTKFNENAASIVKTDEGRFALLDAWGNEIGSYTRRGNAVKRAEKLGLELAA